MTKGIYKRGFTLIELLVVIAIIGILAGIVLAALGNTRQSGADAGIKGNLDTIRTQAEVFAGNNNSDYSNVCTGDSTVTAALASAKSTGGVASVDTAAANASAATKVSCHSSTSAWAAIAPLKTSGQGSWCVDSTGYAGTTTATALGASDYTCQ